MSSLSDELQQVVSSLLLEFAPVTTTRTAYKRAISRTGGSQLLGRSVVVSEEDTVLDPQPVCLRLDRSSPYLQNNALILVDDWMFLLDVNSITRTELTSKDTVLVLKDSLGAEEVFRLIDLQDVAVNAADVVYIGFYRSVDR